MVGITLSAEQIRTAPAEVRRWLEQEIVHTLGLQPGHEMAVHAATTSLVGCNVEEARQVLSLIQGKQPVVSVFFELGREAGSVPVHAMRAIRLADILRNSRLHMPRQVIECLDVLSQALRQTRGDGEAAIYALDDQGHCLVAESTMRSILHVWQEVVAQRGLQDDSQTPPSAGEESAPTQPYQLPDYAVTLPGGAQ